MDHAAIIDVERPINVKRNGRGPDARSFAGRLRETLTTGRALSIPFNGETYAVVRNRHAASGYASAKSVNARLMTARGENSVLIWLEARPSA